MKGDILILDENHRKAGNEAVDLLLETIKQSPRKFVITVAGESGAGKSEVAASIAEKLAESGLSTYIFAQDDYFILPPATNKRKREKDISWVGTQEVRLDLLDKNLKEAIEEKSPITKPLVDFNADSIGEEQVDLSSYDVIIAEGTYTTLLKNADKHVFIDRNKMDTVESRKKRAREPQDAHLDEVLTIEHGIIAPHKEKADIVITKTWNALLNDKLVN